MSFTGFVAVAVPFFLLLPYPPILHLHLISTILMFLHLNPPIFFGEFSSHPVFWNPGSGRLLDREDGTGLDIRGWRGLTGPQMVDRKQLSVHLNDVCSCWSIGELKFPWNFQESNYTWKLMVGRWNACLGSLIVLGFPLLVKKRVWLPTSE